MKQVKFNFLPPSIEIIGYDGPETMAIMKVFKAIAITVTVSTSILTYFLCN